MAKRTLVTVSTDDLSSELKLMEQRIRTLERECSRLGAALAAGPMRFGRKRPRNEMNLEDSLIELLRDQTLSVTQISEDVQKAGYKTTSPNFRTIVNQTLINSPAFKRVSRGKYTVKANYR